MCVTELLKLLGLIHLQLLAEGYPGVWLCIAVTHHEPVANPPYSS